MGFVIAAFLFSGLLIWRGKSLRPGTSLQSRGSASGVVEAPYFSYVRSARGLNVGDPVMLMGLDVGNITDVEPMPPEQFVYDIFVKFVLKAPYYNYVRSQGSVVKVATADRPGKCVFEVTKGTNGYPSYVCHPLVEISPAQARSLAKDPNWVWGQEIWEDITNLVARPMELLAYRTNIDAILAFGYSNLLVMDLRQDRKLMTGIWDDREGRYRPYTNGVSAYQLLFDE